MKSRSIRLILVLLAVQFFACIGYRPVELFMGKMWHSPILKALCWGLLNAGVSYFFLMAFFFKKSFSVLILKLLFGSMIIVGILIISFIPVGIYCDRQIDLDELKKKCKGYEFSGYSFDGFVNITDGKYEFVKKNSRENIKITLAYPRSSITN